MISVNLLVGALDPKRDKRARAGVIVAKAIGGLILFAMGAGMFALGWYGLSVLWQNPTLLDISWTFLIIAGVALLMQGAALGIWVMRTNTQPRAQQAAQVLRELVARGDDQIAPLAKLQPRPLDAQEMLVGPVALKPIRQTQTSLQAVTMSIVAVLVIFLILIPLCAAFTLTTTTVSRSIFPVFSALFPFIFVPIIFIPLLARMRLMRGRGTAVTVDEQGVSWRRGGKQHHIAWNQARALAQVVYSPLASSTTSSSAAAGSSTSYILDAPDDLLIWNVLYNANDAEFAAAESLLRHAMSRTGLALRDISDLANDVAKFGANNAARVLTSRVAITGDDQSRLSAIAQAFPAKPPKPRHTARNVLVTVGLILFAVIDATLPVAAARLQAAQARYSATLLGRIQQETPVIHDSLATDDGEWPVQQATKDDPYSYFYGDGAYHLTGTDPGYVMFARPDLSYNDTGFVDAAYSVTVAETGTLASGYTDGVGLVFHGDYAWDHFNTFTVQSDGHWYLEQFDRVDNEYNDNWHYLDGGHSAAINTGIGALNQLTVVTQGQYIWLFANGQLIEVFHPDSYTDVRLLTTGYAGVFSNETSLTASFQNFSVATAPPQEDFWQAIWQG